MHARMMIFAFAVCVLVNVHADDDAKQLVKKEKQHATDVDIRIPDQVGVVMVDGKPVGITKGVAAIIEAEDKVRSDDDRIRCVRWERTGTHRITRLCQTVREIDERAEASQRDLQRIHRMGKVRGGGGL